MKLGAHSQVLMTANVFIILKPGNGNLKPPKSYHPISLLSRLGKECKRFIALRISYRALKLKILARNQCSAVSRHSAVDFSTALHHDIRNAWEKGKGTDIGTIDVKGTFVEVLRSLLTLRL